MEFSWDILLLVGIGFIAGVINTMAGGGSLLTLPALIFMGLPPNVANGTNRISIFVQNVFSTAGFRSKGISTYPFNIYLGVSAFVGSLIGAQIAVNIRGEVFNRILAIVMIVVVGFIAYRPKIKSEEISVRLTGRYLWVSIIAFFFIGIYGGFIQAGTGFLILLVLSLVNRLDLVRSNATKTVVVLIYTVGAVVLFALNDAIDWVYGFTLSVGSASGAWIASRWSVNKGDRPVKIFLIAMVILMAIKLWFPQLDQLALFK